MSDNGVSPRVVDTLRQLGLTEYGARCYVALLGLREAEASAVADAADVPRTKVYAALKDLVDQGWVVSDHGRPVRYRPVAPEERIALAEKRLSQSADDATRELQARFAHGADMMPMSIYRLRGRPVIQAKAHELVARAREELLVNVGFEGASRALVDDLEIARRRGVRVRLLLASTVDARAYGSLAGEARPALFPFRGIVSDWKQALIMLPFEGEPVALWNPNAAFVEMLRPLLEQAWSASERA